MQAKEQEVDRATDAGPTPDTGFRFAQTPLFPPETDVRGTPIRDRADGLQTDSSRRKDSAPRPQGCAGGQCICPSCKAKRRDRTLLQGVGKSRPEIKIKGQDDEDEVKIKGKASIHFSVIQNNQAQLLSGEGKYQACTAPGPAGQRHRHLDSTAAQIAAMGACTWGITAPDPLGIGTVTCRDGANWRLVVTRVNSVIRSHSRLLPGQAEPVPGVNTTATNFCLQTTELDNLGDCPGAWYMIRAVRAHEDVHVDEWRNNFTTDWTPLETAIEALTVPAAGATADKAAATAAIRGTAVFTNARDTSNGGGNFPVFWGIADPNANTNAAERTVIAPRIRWICKYAKAQGWGPAACPVCVTNGIV